MSNTKTRIGFIRNVLANHNTTVRHHYANGPGTTGGFDPRGPNAGKVLYKIETPFLSSEVTNDIIADLIKPNTVGIENAYVCRNGYIKVVFSERAYN